MALSAATVWEVRQGGADTNGGGFTAGGSGSDYSKQDAAEKSGTDLIINASDATLVQPSGGIVESADVDNLIQITAGTGFTTGFYRITNQDGTYWTLDRAAGTVGSSGGTYAIGGALATPGGQKGAVIGGNIVYIKYSATPITLTTASANAAGGPIAVPASQNVVAVVGYDSTRTVGNTDANRPTIRAGANSTTMFSIGASARGNMLRHVILDANGRTSCIGFTDGSVDRNFVESVKASGFATSFSMAGGARAIKCESVGHTTAGFSGGGVAIGCEAHDGTAVGFTSVTCFHCISESNSGAAVDGFVVNAFGNDIINCTSYNNGRHGFDLSTTAGRATRGINLVSYGNGGFGYVVGSETYLQNHAAGNNTSGAVSGTPVTISTIISLTGDPFTNAASGDFSLDNTASEGAALRAAAFPGAFPGATTTGYLDIGAAQHQDAGGSATVIIVEE